MKASELRLGNYILDDNGEVDIVWSLEHNVEYMLNERFGESEAQPIPLTDAVLEAIQGEVETLGDVAVVIYNAIGIEKVGDLFDIRHIGGTLPVCTMRTDNITYLHQLQNLFFAVTGLELEMDETKLKQAIANEDK